MFCHKEVFCDICTKIYTFYMILYKLSRARAGAKYGAQESNLQRTASNAKVRADAPGFHSPVSPIR